MTNKINKQLNNKNLTGLQFKNLNWEGHWGDKEVHMGDNRLLGHVVRVRNISANGGLGRKVNVTATVKSTKRLVLVLEDMTNFTSQQPKVGIYGQPIDPRTIENLAEFALLKGKLVHPSLGVAGPWYMQIGDVYVPVSVQHL